MIHLTDMKHFTFAIASLFMGIGVACGAFGAHALRGTIPDTDLAIWEKAVLYHLVHSLAALLLLVTPATILEEPRALRFSQLLLIGTLIFSGSLYALVLTNARWLGAITPIGGVCFIATWILVSLSVAGRRAR